MFGTDYWLFMNEAEGNDDIVKTREAKINAVCKDFQRMAAAGISRTQLTASIEKVLTAHGIDGRTLNDRERQKISSCI